MIWLRSNYHNIFFLISLVLSACSDEAKEEAIFRLIPPRVSGVTFSNDLQTSDTLNILTFEYMYNGGGVAVGDVNGDSLPDIFFAGNMRTSRLYLNEGNLRFRDITEESGVQTDRWCTGAAMGDINGDGLLDIYVSVSQSSRARGRKNYCFINRGDLQFEESAEVLGIADTAYSTQAAFLDYDRDGDLDLYVLNATSDDLSRSLIRSKITDGTASSNDHLYRNDGTEGFSRVTREAGILHEGFGLGVAIYDFNHDHWPDILVTNDYLSDDLLYINQQDGSFLEQSADYFDHISHFAMGNDVADINGDELAEVITLDMLPADNYRKKMMSGEMNYDKFIYSLDYGYQPQFMRNMLHLGRKAPGEAVAYSEIGALAGVHQTDWSWSALLADVDNDGLRDLAVTNGYRKDITNRDFIVYRANVRSEAALAHAIDTLSGAYLSNYIFQNRGDLHFSDQTRAWGMARKSYSNGAAFADLDLDGDLDYVVNNIDEAAFVYQNLSREKGLYHYLQLSLQGKEGNQFGIGAKVHLYAGGQMQSAYLSPYRGFQSSLEPKLHFGLGNKVRVDSLIITWPNATLQKAYNITADQHMRMAYRPSANQLISTPKFDPYLTEVSARWALKEQHQESEYVDFMAQPLLPHEYSNLGPALAVGDINGDRRDDLIMGGSAGQPAQIFLQQADQIFRQEKFPLDSQYHDMGILLFDADGDGDSDLYVASGGNEFPGGHDIYRDRLYLNDDTGQFIKTDAIAETKISSSSVSAADFDRDGDPDLLVTGRVSPHNYPMPVSSVLLRNDSQEGKARFNDVTLEMAAPLQEIGMASAALWTDFNNDHWTDLIVVGEWMPITLLENRQGRLVNVTEGSGLEQSYGWWNSLQGADLDGDGDTDYVVGNLGLNSHLKASPEKPVNIFAKDYDENGQIDPLLFYYLGDKSYPLHARDAIMDQLFRLKSAYPTYASFARASEDRFFGASDKKNAYQASAHEMRSVWIENAGNGHFEMHPLPVEAQFAPLFGIQIMDVNRDSAPDILGVGNLFATETTHGRYDALKGLCLLNDGKGNFRSLEPAESGFFVPGDGKALVSLLTKRGKPLLIASQNNDSLRVFSEVDATAQKHVKIKPSETYALVQQGDRRRRVEFYRGDGYLSQSSRYLTLWPGDTAEVFDFQGNRRMIYAE